MLKRPGVKGQGNRKSRDQQRDHLDQRFGDGRAAAKAAAEECLCRPPKIGSGEPHDGKRGDERRRNGQTEGQGLPSEMAGQMMEVRQHFRHEAVEGAAFAPGVPVRSALGHGGAIHANLLGHATSSRPALLAPAGHPPANLVDVGSLGRGLADDAPAAKHHDAVGDGEDFGQVEAQEQHRRPRVPRSTSA